MEALIVNVLRKTFCKTVDFRLTFYHENFRTYNKVGKS